MSTACVMHKPLSFHLFGRCVPCQSNFVIALFDLPCSGEAGGHKTRFRYKQVPASTFGLSVEDLLSRDDKELNQVTIFHGWEGWAGFGTCREDGRELVQERKQPGQVCLLHVCMCMLHGCVCCMGIHLKELRWRAQVWSLGLLACPTKQPLCLFLSS